MLLRPDKSVGLVSGVDPETVEVSRAAMLRSCRP